MELKEIVNASISFRYRLLGRLISDCDYYLGYGNFSKLRLWTHDEKKQIQYMRAIYQSLKNAGEDVQSIISSKEIDRYGRMMVLTKDQHVEGLEVALKRLIEKNKNTTTKDKITVKEKDWTLLLQMQNGCDVLCIKYKNDTVIAYDGWNVIEVIKFYSFPKAYRVLKGLLNVEIYNTVEE